MLTGSMRTQGARLSGPERRAVAEYVTGRALSGDVRGAARGRCSDSVASSRRGSPDAASWNGWSPGQRNTRSQTFEDAGLAADQFPRLRLKWAFGFPDASVAWAQPAIVDGRLFVGSQNGTVYALDATTGCIHWTFTARGGVRTAITVGDGRAYFGDTTGRAYAVDAASGASVWVSQVDDHRLARITGSPVLDDGRLLVPVSSYEESQGADPSYPCCTFRGSLAALDAASGRLVWRTYFAGEPQRRGTSTAGVPLWGPSGAAVWSAPTIDRARRRVYVATGNAYSAPASDMSNAVVAIDAATGAVVWSRQFTAGDVYLTGCRAGNPNCPEVNGPDVDFGSPPMLVNAAGRDMLVIGQKSGWAFAIDAADGREVWRYRAGQGGLLGGIEWGAAADSTNAYFAVSDVTHPQPGGLHAVNLATGQRAWFAPPVAPACARGTGCNAAQSAAVTAIPGAVLSGAFDGVLRAYSTADGTPLWQFDTNREFDTLNGVPARGASIGAGGPAVAGGMVYVGSGYGAFLGRPGNVLLAFGVE
jgi:polyvinyl alcohol dehydrogenase (cytochrome)